MTTKVTDRRIPPPSTHAWQIATTGFDVNYDYLLAPTIQPTIGVYKSIDSVYEGNFRTNVLRLNPVTIRTVVGYHRTGVFTWASKPPYQGKGKGGIEGIIPLHGQVPGPDYGSWSDNMATLSRNKAFAKFNDSETDVAVMMAELGEVIHMLKNPFKDLNKFSDLILKMDAGIIRKAKVASPNVVRRVTSGWSDAKTVGDTWLTYKYGIVPLIKDIESIRAEFNRVAKKHLDLLYRKRGSSSSLSSTQSFGAQTGLLYLSYKVLTTRKVKLKSTSIVYYRVLEESIRLGMLRRYGFSWANVLPVTWEVVPYSFVLDWLVDTNQWLKAIMPNPTIQYKGGCTSQKIEVTETYDTTNHFCNSSYYELTRSEPANFTREMSTLVRVLDSPNPPVHPGIRQSFLDFEKTLSSVALLLQQIPKKWRVR